MKQISTESLFVCCFLFILILEGCSPGIHSGTGGWPPASSPTPVSSSAQVVKLATSSVSIPANASADAVVTLSILPGFHINANPATFPYLIATEVQNIHDPNGEILAGKPIYPAAVKKKFDFAEQPLSVYEGETQIKLPLRAQNPSEKGPRWLPIQIRVQACDNEKCYPPSTLDIKIPVEVK